MRCTIKSSTADLPVTSENPKDAFSINSSFCSWGRRMGTHHPTLTMLRCCSSYGSYGTSQLLPDARPCRESHQFAAQLPSAEKASLSDCFSFKMIVLIITSTPLKNCLSAEGYLPCKSPRRRKKVSHEKTKRELGRQATALFMTTAFPLLHHLSTRKK